MWRLYKPANTSLSPTPSKQITNHFCCRFFVSRLCYIALARTRAAIVRRIVTTTMTVNNAAVSRGSLDCSDLQNKTIGAREVNGDSIGARKSDFDFESQLGRSCVAGAREGVGSEPAEGIRKKVHSQVMRIMEEDLLVGEDVAEGLEKIGGRNRIVASSPVFFSRPILPCSPLSGKASRRQGIALN